MVWAVGLRGAVAYGLALNLPQIEGESDEGIPAIESATLVIVMASTLFLGAATGPLLRFFDLQVPCSFTTRFNAGRILNVSKVGRFKRQSTEWSRNKSRVVESSRAE